MVYVPGMTSESSTSEPLANRRRDLVEELALSICPDGITRMAARVLAVLLLTETSEGLTQLELAAELGASNAAISSATRELRSAGLVAPHSVPGERADRYRVDGGYHASVDELARRYRHTFEILEKCRRVVTAGGTAERRLAASSQYHVALANVVAEFAANWRAAHGH